MTQKSPSRGRSPIRDVPMTSSDKLLTKSYMALTTLRRGLGKVETFKQPFHPTQQYS